MRSTELKIERKNLANQTRDIRKEEREAATKLGITSYEYLNLRNHRQAVVTPIARSAHLAHGFLRGLPYRRIERVSITCPDYKNVARLIRRYGNAPHSGCTTQDIVTWTNV